LNSRVVLRSGQTARARMNATSSDLFVGRMPATDLLYRNAGAHCAASTLLTVLYTGGATGRGWSTRGRKAAVLYGTRHYDGGGAQVAKKNPGRASDD
jgi:hypothetical protein